MQPVTPCNWLALFESLGYRNHGAQETTGLVNHGFYQVFGLRTPPLLCSFAPFWREGKDSPSGCVARMAKPRR